MKENRHMRAIRFAGGKVRFSTAAADAYICALAYFRERHHALIRGRRLTWNDSELADAFDTLGEVDRQMVALLNRPSFAHTPQAVEVIRTVIEFAFVGHDEDAAMASTILLEQMEAEMQVRPVDPS